MTMHTLGIGITTYNRRGALEQTLERVRRHTIAPHLLAVADDGSTDGTAQVLESQNILTVRGLNRGIAWNKNRLLYLLNNVARCEVIILLEDDTYPTEDGWEGPWVRAALLHGHINFAGDWFKEQDSSGNGTPDDPVRSPHTSGQCVAFTSEAIEAVGFMDTRYRRYGYEHTEHSIRLIKAGFGGVPNAAAPNRPTYYLLASPLTVNRDHSYGDNESIQHNLKLFGQIRDESIHRWAWRGDDEMAIFLSEIAPAIKALRTPKPQPPVPAKSPAADPATIASGLDKPHLFGDEFSLMQRAFGMVGPNYLEWGTGGSTLLAVNRGNTVVSVESDSLWAAGVRARREIAEAVSAGRATILHADIGPVGAFGHPQGRDHMDRWISYLYLPWKEWSRRGATPDLVYVDGRFRVACCLSVIVALAEAASTGKMPLVLVHDISDTRPFYNPIFDFYEVIEAVGSLCLLRVRPGAIGPAAIAEMLRHQNDAR
jgi:hypothetical protein